MAQVLPSKRPPCLRCCALPARTLLKQLSARVKGWQLRMRRHYRTAARPLCLRCLRWWQSSPSSCPQLRLQQLQLLLPRPHSLLPPAHRHLPLALLLYHLPSDPARLALRTFRRTAMGSASRSRRLASLALCPRGGWCKARSCWGSCSPSLSSPHPPCRRSTHGVIHRPGCQLVGAHYGRSLRLCKCQRCPCLAVAAATALVPALVAC